MTKRVPPSREKAACTGMPERARHANCLTSFNALAGDPGDGAIPALSAATGTARSDLVGGYQRALRSIALTPQPTVTVQIGASRRVQRPSDAQLRHALTVLPAQAARRLRLSIASFNLPQTDAEAQIAGRKRVDSS
jgi:hypothetical protein